MTAIVTRSKQSIASVDLKYIGRKRVDDLKASGPGRHLVLGMGSVDVEESDKCSIFNVAHVSDLQLARGVWLGVPECIA